MKHRSILTGEALVVTAVVFFLAILAWPMRAATAAPRATVAPELADAHPLREARRPHRL